MSGILDIIVGMSMTINSPEPLSGTIRFVVITVPGGGVLERLNEAMGRVRDAGNTYLATGYPPHITLRTGALVPVDRVAGFLADFASHLGSWQPFPIKTDGIVFHEDIANSGENFFIYYRIVPSEALLALHRHLLGFSPYIKRKQTAFHPHLSLAYEDLSRSGFEAIRKLVDFEKQLFPDRYEWQCDNVSLYHQVNGRWVPFKVFSLGSPHRNDL